MAPGHALCVKKMQQLHEPLRAAATYGAQFPIAVLRHQHKAVVIVVELRFITVWKHLRHSLPAARKAANHIIMGNIMPATLYPVGNP